MSERISIIEPEGFPPAKGYANGVLTTGGRTLHIAGQIAWDGEGRFHSDDFSEQFGAALDNVVAVVRAAGGSPGDVVRMTIYVTDLDAYRSSAPALGAVWRERFARHYPAMALVGVAGLVHPRALIEIEAVACLPDTTAADS